MWPDASSGQKISATKLKFYFGSTLISMFLAKSPAELVTVSKIKFEHFSRNVCNIRCMTWFPLLSTHNLAADSDNAHAATSAVGVIFTH